MMSVSPLDYPSLIRKLSRAAALIASEFDELYPSADLATAYELVSEVLHELIAASARRGEE